MEEFARLFQSLDQSNKVSDKTEALVHFFLSAPDEDKIWGVALLSGRRPKRPIKTSLLRLWAGELSGIPDWLLDESYQRVGDLAETLALLLPPPVQPHSTPSLAQYMDQLRQLAQVPETTAREMILSAWLQMPANQRIVFNKLITGGFRVGVSQNLVVRALSKVSGLEISHVQAAITGNWSAYDTTFSELLHSTREKDASKPYPFCLAYPLEPSSEDITSFKDYMAERKWDGIRGQLVFRNGRVFIWTRGEELVTDRFPEFQLLRDMIPEGTVLDGEILPRKDGLLLSFQHLQKRLGRKTVSAKLLKEIPLHFMAYDLLEQEGKDIRTEPFEVRRKKLENLLPDHALISCSPLLYFDSLEDLYQLRRQSREMQSEGLMLKHRLSEYVSGRKRGIWWKWKCDPFQIDAVLIYAQRGHGRRANLYTDYTFAVWSENGLVAFTKAYSGLTDQELKEVDAWIRKNTLEKFGPVRSVTPQLVFEIGFEGIQASPRHKSGIALRFPRILRWRRDKKLEEADHLDTLKALLAQHG